MAAVGPCSAKANYVRIWTLVRGAMKVMLGAVLGDEVVGSAQKNARYVPGVLVFDRDKAP